MRVSASKGLANHTVPESWLVYREVYLQALTEVRVDGYHTVGLMKLHQAFTNPVILR